MEDAQLLLPLYIAQARNWVAGRDRHRALQSARRAVDLAARLQQVDVQVEAGLLVSKLLFENGRGEESAQTLDDLMAFPGCDDVTIAFTRARLFTDTGRRPRSRNRGFWRDVLRQRVSTQRLRRIVHDTMNDH